VFPSVGDKNAFVGNCSLLESFPSSFIYYAFYRKSFCGYARVDVNVNYTRDSVHKEDEPDHEEDASSHNEGQLYLIWF